MGKQTIKEMAQYCLDSYEGNGSRPLDGNVFRVFKDIAYVVDYNGGKLIISRGSDDFKDWKSNFKIQPKRSAKIGNCHSGFLETADAFYTAMIDLLKYNKSEVFYFTGHSRAGATMLILAMLMEQRGFKVATVYTFGAPRALYKGTKCKVDHVRTVSVGDIVPSFPRAYWGFKHVGELIKLKGSWWSYIPILRVKSHSINEYIRRLK